MTIKKLEALKSLGVAGILSRLLVIIYQGIRKIFYWFISNNRPLRNEGSYLQPAIFLGKGKIFVGNSRIGYWPSPYHLTTTAHIEAREVDAVVTIGENVFINNNCVIIAEKTSITIQDNCLIGSNFTVFDSDFHELEKNLRNSGRHSGKPVSICKNVFIGNNVTILKGVCVGTNAVIGSGSVVLKDVLPSAVVGGNPAKFIRYV